MRSRARAFLRSETAHALGSPLHGRERTVHRGLGRLNTLVAQHLLLPPTGHSP